MPRFHADTDSLAGPPPEVLAEIDAAWERAQELFNDEELELHFEVDRRFGRAWAELRTRRRPDPRDPDGLRGRRDRLRDAGVRRALARRLAVTFLSRGRFRGGTPWSYSDDHGSHTQGHHLRRRRSRAQGRLRRDRPLPPRSLGRRDDHHDRGSRRRAHARGWDQDRRHDARLDAHGARARPVLRPASRPRARRPRPRRAPRARRSRRRRRRPLRSRRPPRPRSPRPRRRPSRARRRSPSRRRRRPRPSRRPRRRRSRPPKTASPAASKPAASKPAATASAAPAKPAASKPAATATAPAAKASVAPAKPATVRDAEARRAAKPAAAKPAETGKNGDSGTAETAKPAAAGAASGDK